MIYFLPIKTSVVHVIGFMAEWDKCLEFLSSDHKRDVLNAYLSKLATFHSFWYFFIAITFWWIFQACNVGAVGIFEKVSIGNIVWTTKKLILFWYYDLLPLFGCCRTFYYNISSPFSSYHNISTLWTIVIGRFMRPFAVLMINLLLFPNLYDNFLYSILF